MVEKSILSFLGPAVFARTIHGAFLDFLGIVGFAPCKERSGIMVNDQIKEV